MHAADPADAPTFSRLRAARRSFRGFGLPDVADVASQDPETVARQYLAQSLESQDVPDFALAGATEATTDFKSLGTETLALTDTRTVKFRQIYNKIPVYSSLVTVELDKNNEFLSINSTLGTPENVSPIAKISPAAALQAALKRAGTKAADGLTPKLFYYLDRKNKRWRLVYIIEDVPVSKPQKGETASTLQLAMDYVIDAHSGALVAELPRTASANEVDAVDGLNVTRRIRFRVDDSGKKVLFDGTLNVVTHEFGFKDPEVRATELPGQSVTNPPDPWLPEAVSAHANAAAVAVFLRDVVRRNNIDNRGGAMISTVNCVVARNNPLTQKQWLNAFWSPARRQMVYGQVLHGGKLRSLAVNLDVVGHEMFHGVTNDSSRLEYQDESGALNESYSDIFGILISNRDKASIADWDFELGEKLVADDKPLRDLSKPSRFGQPEHMDDFLVTTRDFGGVHTNSGIHNFAAFKVFTSKSGGAFLFKPTELAAIFYISLTQQLTATSGFSASRRGVTLAAKTLFRNEPAATQQTRLGAIAAAFDAVGIREPA
jgi:Zn-dependent metalloprotease